MIHATRPLDPDVPEPQARGKRICNGSSRRDTGTSRTYANCPQCLSILARMAALILVEPTLSQFAAWQRARKE